MKITSLFISSESSSSDVLEQFCHTHHIRCIRKSFIAFEAVPFEVNVSFDAIFFTSPRSFDYFIASYRLTNEVAISCIGEETKKHIEHAGFSVSFYGVEAGNPQQVAIELKSWLQSKHLLIPQSNRSNKSIEAILDFNQFTPLVVYKTCLNPQIIPTADVYIFTSPSNVESFLSKNTIPIQSIVIAWGKTTREFLSKNEISTNYVLNSSTYLELLKLMHTLC